MRHSYNRSILLNVFVILILSIIAETSSFAQNEQKMFYALNTNPYLLDQVPTITPSIAYSVRKLKRKYTGPSMRVRRNNSGADAEADVYFDGSGVVSGNSNVIVTIAGGGASVGDVMSFSSFYSGLNVYVKTWYDQSGNGNNAVQTTTSAQPQIVKTGVLVTENGKSSIEFAGLHSSILLNLTTALNLTNGSLFGVYNLITAATTAGLADNGTYSYNVNTFNNTGKIGVTQYTVSDVASTINYGTTLDVVSWSKSSVNTYVEIDNRTSTSTAALNIPIAVAQVYGNALTTTVIHISELIITGYATTTQRPSVFKNQKAFYNTP